jgi:P-type Ca2+ transporter type 2C
VLTALGISLVPVALIVFATELPRLQEGLSTVALTGSQWLAAIGLALLLPLVVELSKLVRRRRAPAAEVGDVQGLLAPARARVGVTVRPGSR